MSPVALAISAKTGGAMKSASHHHQSGLGGIVGRGELLIEAGLHRVHHLRVFVEEVLLHVHLADGLIVGMLDARAGLPVELVAQILHGLLVLVAGYGIGHPHEAGVERGPGPVGLRNFGHAAELPIGDDLHGLGEVGLFELQGRGFLRAAREWLGSLREGRRGLSAGHARWGWRGARAMRTGRRRDRGRIAVVEWDLRCSFESPLG